MARSVWSGAVSFGLVNVPVRLYTATENHDVRFHNFERGTGERIRHRRVAEESGHEVDFGDIVKGYEIRPGEHVIVEQDELESVEPGKSRTIEIEDFVDLDAVDPVYFGKTYYVAPAGEDAGRPYELLRRVLDDAQRVGVGRFAMRGKQHLAVIRPLDDVLALETMFFADEIRDPAALDELGAHTEMEVGERELDVARQLVDSLTTEWEPDRYEDTYRTRVMDLIERKAEGESIVVEAADTGGAEVVDLMAALERSVSEARSRRNGGAAGADDGQDRSAEPDTGEPDTADGASLESLTRDELYERAQARDVEGRSKMSKPELIEALRAAS